MGSTVDPSIPLSVNTQGVDLRGMLSLADMANKVQQEKQKSAATNMLRQLFTTPGALDKQGNPTPETIQKTMAIDPETGLELRESTLAAQVQQMQANHYATQAGRDRFDFLSGTAGVATDAYNAAKAAGKSEADAISAATTARNDALKNNGGILGEQDTTAALAAPFDPLAAKTFAMANPDYSARVGKERSEERQERMEGERERHDEAMEAMATRKDDKGKFTPYQEPDTKDEQGKVVPGRVLSYDTTRGKYFDAEGQEVTPGKVQKVGSGTGPQTPTLDMSDPHDADYVKAIANYDIAPPSKGRNPEYSKRVMEAVIAVNPQYQEGDYTNRQSAKRAFNTGRQGDTTRSLNVSVAHLAVLDELGQALKNGEAKTINAIGNKLADQFGDERPNDFNMAKIIVGDEVEKAVKAGVGTGEERANLQERFSAANSPEQLSGVIRTAKKLLTGQLTGLEKQYETSTGAKDFRNKLFPETVQELGGSGVTASGAHKVGDIIVQGGKRYKATKVENGKVMDAEEVP